jgi:hypothetical protein
VFSVFSQAKNMGLLMMNISLYSKIIDADSLTQIFEKLKAFYKVDSISPERKTFIKEQVQKYGYLPISFYKALKEITPAEALLGIEEKFKIQDIYQDGKFQFDMNSISPVARAGYYDSRWIKKEQLNIKLLNLAALGDGNENRNVTGKFKDWIRQLLILSSGNKEFGVLGTVMYFVPFHPRDFGCAYLPKTKFISESLEDTELKENLGLSLQEQVSVFLMLCQLAGHPTMYDVLPQTGRYASTVLANPFIARWYNIPELNAKLKSDLDIIAEDLKKTYDPAKVETVKTIIADSLDGLSENTPCEDSSLEETMEAMLDKKRKQYSEEMTAKVAQQELVKVVRAKIAEVLDVPEDRELYEEDILSSHNEIIGKLISSGLWPSPGGAWCSCGIPIYDRMVAGGGHPLFKHYDVRGNDVTGIANLDCQTPFYFVHLESGEYNRPVIDFWADFLVELQQKYNFDAFRVDHIDHIVDPVSQKQDGTPISYRAPAKVLGEITDRLRQANPYFALLAEYMLWDGYLKEYHQDMGFDILWGSDIVSQDQKNIKRIIKDNTELYNYNNLLPNVKPMLSILKTYNNQDGEFREIDQYPGQLDQSGALFKWFKFKFLPASPLAERPVMYIDGDESFTKTGVERVIGEEISMVRNDDEEFFRQFDAINRLALHNIFSRYGISEIWHGNEMGDGLIAWFIKKQPEFGDDERLFIVANENPPRQVLRKADNEYQLYSEWHEYSPVWQARVNVPDGFMVASEYILPENSYEFTEKTVINNIENNVLCYEKIDPSEYHIYRIKRIQ